MDWEIEGEALSIYKLAKQDPDRPVSPSRLVRKLLETSVQRLALVGDRESDLACVAGQHVIGVSRRASPARARWLVCHELAHWWFDRLGYRGEDLEARCDALGAALIAPRPAWRTARRLVGDDVKRLAEMLATTQSLVLLRCGECDGTPAALVGQRRVIVRGIDFAWPDEDVIRRVARSGYPGVRKVRISDEYKRTGLMAEVVEVA